MLPLAAAAAAHGTAAHVERHWLHGPHLRLRLQGTDPARVAVTAEAMAGRVRAWLHAHPSQSDLTEAQLLERAAEAGRAELVAPPYGPVLPDNTVRIEPVDRSSVRGLLGADGTALREDLLRSGLDALRAGAGFLGRHGDTDRARLRLAVTALAAHACAHPGGLTGGHWSYVSHLEDFLLHDDPDGRLRATFERHGERAGDTVTALVGRIAEGGAEDWEQAWAGFRRAPGGSRRSATTTAPTCTEIPSPTGSGQQPPGTPPRTSAGTRTSAPATASSTDCCAAPTRRARCGAAPTTSSTGPAPTPCTGC